MVSLWLKRLGVLKKRHLICFFTLFFSIIFFSLSYLLPTSSDLVNLTYSLFDTEARNTEEIELSLSFYNKKSFSIPFSINRNDEKSAESAENFKKFIINYYAARKSVKLENVLKQDSNKSVGDYVLTKRLSDVNCISENYPIGFDFNFGNSLLDKVTLFYNTMAFHSNGVVLNELNSLLLAFYTNKSSLSVRNAPLVNPSKLETNELEGIKTVSMFLECIESIPFSIIDVVVGLVVSFLISLSVVQVTRERNNKSKRLQIMSGVHPLLYWISNFIFDLFIYLINISAIILIIKIIAVLSKEKSNEYKFLAMNSSNLSYLFLFLIITSFSWSTLAYIWSNMFKSDILAFVTLFILLNVVMFIDIIFAASYMSISFSDSVSAFNRTRTFLKYSRIAVASFFPNVAAKRAVFSFKFQSDKNCQDMLSFFKEVLKSRILNFICYY